MCDISIAVPPSLGYNFLNPLLIIYLYFWEKSVSSVGSICCVLFFFLPVWHPCLLIDFCYVNSCCYWYGWIYICTILLFVFCMTHVFFVSLFLLYCFLLHSVHIFLCNIWIPLMVFSKFFFLLVALGLKQIHLLIRILQAYNNLITVRYRNVTLYSSISSFPFLYCYSCIFVYYKPQNIFCNYYFI